LIQKTSIGESGEMSTEMDGTAKAQFNQSVDPTIKYLCSCNRFLFLQLRYLRAESFYCCVEARLTSTLDVHSYFPNFLCLIICVWIRPNGNLCAFVSRENMAGSSQCCNHLHHVSLLILNSYLQKTAHLWMSSRNF